MASLSTTGADTGPLSTGPSVGSGRSLASGEAIGRLSRVIGRLASSGPGSLPKILATTGAEMGRLSTDSASAAGSGSLLVIRAACPGIGVLPTVPVTATEPGP